MLIRYPKLILVVENKSSAQTLIDTVIIKLTAIGIDPFKRMYNKIADEHILMADEYQELLGDVRSRKEIVNQKNKKHVGFQSNKNTREYLYDTVINDAMKSSGHLINDEILSSEIRALVSKNGRIDHPKGAHDDLVIAWLLTHWFVKHTKNLSYYGIDTRSCLSLSSTEGAIMSEEELAKKREVIVLNVEINELKEKIMAISNIADSLRFEKLLENKVLRAQSLGDTALNLNGIIAEVKERRVSKAKLNYGLNAINNRYSNWE
jgi:hypothetical protein